MSFSIIPVLDIKAGVAVHAVGGTRHLYQPLKTILQEGSRPIDVARAFRDRLGLTSLYVADLDAITGDSAHFPLYDKLVQEGFRLLVDLGIKHALQAFRLPDSPSITWIIGLETIQSPDAARSILGELSAERIIFSLDQSQGRPLTATPNLWNSDSPFEIADRAIDLGFTRILILDLARVGTGTGTGAVPLLRSLRGQGRTLEILVGGGIAGIEDILELKQEGASGVLVGSAFHDGRIGARELASA